MKKLFLTMVVAIAFASCAKEYADYSNLEVVTNNYTGDWEVTSIGDDPAGDFEGSGDNGTYSFAWDNSEKLASVNFDITSNSGSVQMIVNDAKGDEVLNQVIQGGLDEDTFAGVTSEGKKGMWLITIILTDFNGDGSYSLHPGN